MSQPPSQVKVGTEFVVSVMARLTDGSPLANAIISVNTTKTATDMLSNLKNRIINLLGTSDASVSAFADLAEQTSRAVINPSRCVAVTDSDGQADFYLMFEAGVSGNYTLKFETAMSAVSTSDESEEFELVNPVYDLQWLGLDTEDITVNFEKDGTTYKKTTVTLSANPLVYLKDSSGEVLTSHNALRTSAKLVDYSQIVAAAEAMSVDPRNVSLTSIASSINFSESTSAVDKIKKLWDTVTNAAQVVGTMRTVKNEFAGNYSGVYFNATDYSLGFVNVSFSITQPGIYMLVLSVDGVESKTGLFNIQDQEAVTAAEEDTLAYEDGIAYALVGVLVMVNVPRIGRFFMISAIGLIASELYFVTYTAKGTQYQVFVYIILSLIASYCIYALVEEYVTKGRNGFDGLSEQTSFAYTKRMFERRSLLSKEDSSVASSVTSRAEEKPLRPRWYWLVQPFIPFYFSRHRVDSEAFYYPQRFVMSLVLGVLTFVYATVQICSFVVDLLNQYGSAHNRG